MGLKSSFFHDDLSPGKSTGDLLYWFKVAGQFRVTTPIHILIS